MNNYDLIIIGGGASGMLCAIEAKKNNLNVLLIEKDPIIGGFLNSCDTFIDKSNHLTGIDYIKNLKEEFNKLNIDTKLNTLVIKIDENNGLICTSPENGVEILTSKYFILANGSKEKGINSFNIPGDRCTGVYTLGNAKKILNMDNASLGKDIIILGTSNLHLIKSSLEKNNIKIKAIIGSNDNCLNNITSKFYTHWNLKSIYGNGRIENIVISNNSEDLTLSCDTLIIALGSIPCGLVAMRSNIELNPNTTSANIDNNYETSRKSIFACGDGVFIHNFIEDIKNESKSIINYILNL